MHGDLFDQRALNVAAKVFERNGVQLDFGCGPRR